MLRLYKLYMKKKKLKKPFFSIITVVKNDEANIQKTIKSVISQSFKNFEYIVIDGKSKDKTIKKINDYKNKISCILSQKDAGIYFAMNKGIKIANGTFLLFVNSGDLLTKNALKIIYELFSKNKKVDFIFGTVKRHYTTNTIIKYGYNKFRLNYNFDFATAHSTGFFIKLNSAKKVGLYNLKYKYSSDWDYFYRMIVKHKLNGIGSKKNELFGIFRRGGFSSKISFRDHFFEEITIRLDNNQNKILVLLIFIYKYLKHFKKI